MTIYQIKQTASGAVLWTGQAADANGALDAMAREAGYIDFQALPAKIRSAGVVATELTHLR